MFGIKMEPGSYIGLEREELRKDLLKEKRDARKAAEQTWQDRYDLQKEDSWNLFLDKRKLELEDKKTLKQIDLNNDILKEITKSVLSGVPIDLTGVTTSGGGSKDKKIYSRDESYSILYGLLGENDDITSALARIEAVKDPRALSLLANMTQNVYNKFVEQGYDSPEILVEKTNELMMPVLTDAILTAPDPSKADDLIKRLTNTGVKLNKTVTNLIKNQVGTTGSMTILNEPIVMPKLGVSEIGLFQEQLEDIARARARTEQGRLNKAKATITRNLEDANISSDRRVFLNSLASWIATRDSSITEAIKLTQGDSPDFYELYALYGNAGVSEIIKQEPRMALQSISPIFRKAMDSAPIQIPSQEFFDALMTLNIFREGDIFTYPDKNTGQMVTKPWKGN